MKKSFKASVWREGDWFVAQCLDVDVASQGRSDDEALAKAAHLSTTSSPASLSACYLPTRFCGGF